MVLQIQPWWALVVTSGIPTMAYNTYPFVCQHMRFVIVGQKCTVEHDLLQELLLWQRAQQYNDLATSCMMTMMIMMMMMTASILQLHAAYDCLDAKYATLVVSIKHMTLPAWK